MKKRLAIHRRGVAKWKRRGLEPRLARYGPARRGPARYGGARRGVARLGEAGEVSEAGPSGSAFSIDGAPRR
jgi:hypothetical protein